MRTVTLYGRPGCHLCDDALHRRYLERIPVIALDGEELFDFFVDEPALAERLRDAERRAEGLE